jgi:hypothetical protein
MTKRRLVAGDRWMIYGDRIQIAACEVEKIVATFAR